jgi:hypothetical protein
VSRVNQIDATRRLIDTGQAALATPVLTLPPSPWVRCVHGGDEQQHHNQLSSEEQVDLGHGEKGPGVSEQSLSPLARFWPSSPAKEQRLQALPGGVCPGLSQSR